MRVFVLFSALNSLANAFQSDISVAEEDSERAKRQIPGLPCGCLSKFTPVNCRCTNMAGDELLCRCDKALLTSSRNDDPPHCGHTCRQNSLSQQQQSNFPTPPPPGLHSSSSAIQTACHPICHQSCVKSCSRGRELLERAHELIDKAPFQRDPNTGGGAQMHLQHQMPEPPPPCHASQCKANCLRACSRIIDSNQQQRMIGGGQELPPPLPPSIREPYLPFQNGVEPPPTHFQVGSPTIEAQKQPDYYGGLGERPENGAALCACPQGTFCDCSENCFPICFDSCENNCLQQQHQSSAQQVQMPNDQRRPCAQYCHLECQRNCGGRPGRSGQQQQQQLAVWPNQLPLQNGNELMNGGGTQNLSPGGYSLCATKCPKACEQACANTHSEDPNGNCEPACISMCNQQCARGNIQLDDEGAAAASGGSGQSEQMVFNATPGQTFDVGAAIKQYEQQQRQNGTNTGRVGMLNDWGEGEGGNARMKVAEVMMQEDTGSSGAEQMMNHNNGGPSPFGLQQQPCAPLCQPECRPECNRRYLEERAVSTAGNGGKHFRAAPDDYSLAQPWDGPKQEQQAENRMPPSAVQSQLLGEAHLRTFPPHIILPALNDGLGQLNETKITAKNSEDPDEEVVGPEEGWLRPQNETGLPTGNGTVTPIDHKTNKLVDNETEKQPSGTAKSGQHRTLVVDKKRVLSGGDQNKITRAMEFFKRREHLMGGDKSRAKATKKMVKAPSLLAETPRARSGESKTTKGNHSWRQ